MKKDIRYILAKDMVANPLNKTLFRELKSSEKEQLEQSVKGLGIVSHGAVYEIGGGQYMLLSGHNRRDLILEQGEELGIEGMYCDVVKKPETETAEILLMVAYNLGRGLSDVWVVKVFDNCLKILCQIRKNDDIDEITNDDTEIGDENGVAYNPSPFDKLIQERFAAFDVKGMRARDVLRKALRISQHQYDCLVMLCSSQYREKLYNRVMKVAKLKKNAIAEWDAEFAKIIAAVETKDISLNAACGLVKDFVSQIEALEKKKIPKAEKPVKATKPMPAPKKKEKDVEFEVEHEADELPYNTLTPELVFDKYGLRLDNDAPIVVADNVVLVLSEDLHTVYSITEYELTTYLDGLRGAK